MSRSIFGWDLPPGCTQRHIDEAAGIREGQCECCGHNVDSCICPECSICGAAGDPECYSVGHISDDVRLNGKLEFTKAQLIGQARQQLEQLRQQVADVELSIEVLESQSNTSCPKCWCGQCTGDCKVLGM